MREWTAANDDNAEGSAQMPEPEGARQVMSLPRVRSPHGPVGETGLLPMLGIPAESAPLDERQDASRTTAENNAVAEPAPEADEDVETRPVALIVEDSPELADLLRITLRRIHVDSVIEPDGHSALARYRALRPDLIMLDIGLPDMTGWRVLEGMKQDAEANAIVPPPVIVITSYSDASNRLMGKFQQVYSYIVKPFTASDIIARVQQALSDRVG